MGDDQLLSLLVVGASLWVFMLRGEPVCSQAGWKAELFMERERKCKSLHLHSSARSALRFGPSDRASRGGRRVRNTLEEYQHLLEWGEEGLIKQPGSGGELPGRPAGRAQRSDHRSGGSEGTFHLFHS